MISNKICVPALLSALLITTGTIAREDVSYRLVSKMIDLDSKRAPTYGSFGCSDRPAIRTTIHSDRKDLYTAPVVVEWVRPDGEVERRTPFDVSIFEGNARLEAWIELHKPQYGSMLSFINPEMGMEDFIGKWTVNTIIDGERRGESLEFRIEC